MLAGRFAARKYQAPARDQYDQRGDRGGKRRERRNASSAAWALRPFAGFGLRGAPTCKRIDPDRFGDVLELRRAEIADREIETPPDLTVGVLGQQQIAPAWQMPSSRAAILTPSPIRSPSLSLTTSPRWMPTRNSMRRSGGRPALRSMRPFCTSIAKAHRVDHAAKLDEAPVAGALDDAPMMRGEAGRSDRSSKPRRRESVRSSSAPASRL